MPNPNVMWILDIVIILFALLQAGPGLRRIVRSHEEQLLFNAYQFELYHSKTAIKLEILFWTVFIVLLAIVISLGAFDIVLFLSAPLVFLNFISTVRRIRWRFEVDGPSASIRTFLFKRRFSLSEVTRVELANETYFGISSGFATQVILFGSNRRLVKIPIGAVNFSMLADRLYREGIIELQLFNTKGELIARDENTKPRGLGRILDNTKEGRLGFLFLFTILSSLTLFFLPMSFDHIFMVGATDVRDILVRFLIWMTVWVGCILISRVLLLQGSLFLIRRRRNQGRSIIVQSLLLIATVLLTRWLFDFVLFDYENAHIPDMGNALADLRAIDEGVLNERLVTIILNNENERATGITVNSTAQILYRLYFRVNDREDHLRLIFPLDFAPHIIREQALPDYYELERESEHVLNQHLRTIEVRYTPNMHLVMDVTVLTQEAINERANNNFDEDDYNIDIDPEPLFPSIDVEFVNFNLFTSPFFVTEDLLFFATQGDLPEGNRLYRYHGPSGLMSSIGTFEHRVRCIFVRDNYLYYTTAQHTFHRVNMVEGVGGQIAENVTSIAVTEDLIYIRTTSASIHAFDSRSGLLETDLIVTGMILYFVPDILRDRFIFVDGEHLYYTNLQGENRQRISEEPARKFFYTGYSIYWVEPQEHVLFRYDFETGEEKEIGEFIDAIELGIIGDYVVGVDEENGFFKISRIGGDFTQLSDHVFSFTIFGDEAVIISTQTWYFYLMDLEGQKRRLP